ncbi:MAG: SMI1/KNR4 family protein [Bdellovibrio sp.]|nr:SMI1/KNR4 family protein [Methylotenera sp.]
MNKIWQSPKYLPYVQPTLTDAILADAEKQIGYKLPAEYIDLLMIQNGGYIRYTIKETVHSLIAGIGPYYPSITNLPDWSESEDWGLSFKLVGLIPFDGDGHWHLCFDYRNQPVEPKITLIDIECDREELIAKNFKEYLSLLVMQVEDDYVIETSLSVDAAVEQVATISKAAIAKIDFEAPDAWAHGYVIYRGKYKGKWVWISPNKAPSGFVRSDDKRYDELKSQMETSDCRFPELPDNALLISTSDDKTTKALLKLLTENGLKIAALTTYL